MAVVAVKCGGGGSEASAVAGLPAGGGGCDARRVFTLFSFSRYPETR